MSAPLRLVLGVLAFFSVASCALGYPVSVSTSGTSTGGGVVFSSGLVSFFPPEPTSLHIADSGPVCPPVPVCGYQGLGHGEASADLAAGTLGVYVSGWHGDADIWTFIARASFTESLVFYLPPGMASAQVTLSMSIHADLPPQAIHGRVLGGALLSLGLDGSGVNFQAAALNVPSHFAQVLH
jgi:hypothetical protein